MSWKLIVVAALVLAACRADEPADTSAAALPPVVTTTTTTTTAIPSTTTTTGPAPDEASTTSTAAVPPLQSLALEEVATGLESPVWVGGRPGDERLFVVEQPGRIVTVAAGETDDFLDISSRVRFGGERGLLGMAFHPDDPDRLYVNYTQAGSGDTIVSEFRMDDGEVDGDSERVLLEIPQPAGNHNGGNIAFGPDGFLYIGMGDGGGSNDQFGHGQRPDTLLGTLLRIQPDRPDDASEFEFAVPESNPFADGVDGHPAVWAYGLRNPWRFTFDGNDLYIGDVGQGDIEEIDVVAAEPAGYNFGWPLLEGTECFLAAGCDPAGTVLPVLEYDHGDGCSVTGGVVYRGADIPELDGHYLYADYCSGWVRSFRLEDGGTVDQQELFTDLGLVSSFGVDNLGEVYVVVHDGHVLKLTAVR